MFFLELCSIKLNRLERLNPSKIFKYNLENCKKQEMKFPFLVQIYLKKTCALYLCSNWWWCIVKWNRSWTTIWRLTAISTREWKAMIITRNIALIISMHVFEMPWTWIFRSKTFACSYTMIFSWCLQAFGSQSMR